MTQEHPCAQAQNKTTVNTVTLAQFLPGSIENSPERHELHALAIINILVTNGSAC
jgi:hypothetical protein